MSIVDWLLSHSKISKRVREMTKQLETITNKITNLLETGEQDFYQWLEENQYKVVGVAGYSLKSPIGAWIKDNVSIPDQYELRVFTYLIVLFSPIKNLAGHVYTPKWSWSVIDRIGNDFDKDKELYGLDILSVLQPTETDC